MAVISMEVRNPYGGSFRQVLRTDDRHSNRTPHTIAYDLYGEALISVNKPNKSEKDLENTTDGITFVSKGREMRKSIVKDSSRKISKRQE